MQPCPHGLGPRVVFFFSSGARRLEKLLKSPQGSLVLESIGPRSCEVRPSSVSCPGDAEEHDHMGVGLQHNKQWMEPDVPESRRSLYANILHSMHTLCSEAILSHGHMFRT